MMVKLGDLGQIITGNTPKTSEQENYNSNDICFIKPSDFNEENISFIEKSEFYISDKARNKARIIPKNSILVTCIGIIGKVAINNIECAFNQQINAIIPKENKCITNYVAYAIQFQKDYIQDIANAAVVPILNKTQFSNIEIPLPPLEEQCKIAETLDKVSDLIEKRKQQLEKLDLLVKSKFVEMFGDPITNPKNWITKSLLEIGICKNGMNFRYDDSGVEIHCLGVGDFKDLSVIDNMSILPVISLNEMPTEDYLLKDGDIVFVRSNGNKELVGRCLVVYPKDTITTFSGFCIRFRKTYESITIPYLLQVLKSDSIRKNMAGRGANIQNLNQQILNSLVIPIPPIELQNQFADFVKQTEKTKTIINQSLEKLETLKKALMQEYFN